MASRLLFPYHTTMPSKTYLTARLKRPVCDRTMALLRAQRRARNVSSFNLNENRYRCEFVTGCSVILTDSTGSCLLIKSKKIVVIYSTPKRTPTEIKNSVASLQVAA